MNLAKSKHWCEECLENQRGHFPKLFKKLLFAAILRDGPNCVHFNIKRVYNFQIKNYSNKHELLKPVPDDRPCSQWNVRTFLSLHLIQKIKRIKIWLYFKQPKPCLLDLISKDQVFGLVAQ